MRKAVAVLTLLLLSSCGHGEVKTSPNFLSLKKEAYQKGYYLGYRQGEIDGYKSRFKQILFSVYEWERDRTARLVGGYLMRSGVLNSPEFFFEKKGNSAVVKAENSSVNLGKMHVILRTYVPPKEGEFISLPLLPEKPQVKGCSYGNPIQQISCLSGQKKGYADGFKKGEKDAERDAYSVLKKFKDEIVLLESEKYLNEDGALTYPSVFFKEGVLEVGKSLYEQPLTIREILSFVPYSEREKRKEEEFNGVSIPATAGVHPVLENSDRQKKPYDVELLSTPDTLTVLQREGIFYYVRNGKITARFYSSEDAEKFCLKYPYLCKEGEGERDGGKKAHRR